MALAAFAGSAKAAPTFTVNSTLDEPDATLNGTCSSTPSGVCTLRAALQEAEFAGGGTVVVPAGLYVLNHDGAPPDTDSIGDLDISHADSILGVGGDRTIIDGNGTHRVFDIHAPTGDATISGVSIRNGVGELDPLTGHLHGGAIHNHGKLTLIDSTVSGSSAPAAGWGGGAITNASGATATLQNDTISGDSSNTRGGGIENLGTTHLFNVTISQNSAPAGFGGGIYTGVGASTDMNESIVAKNTTGGDCANFGTFTDLGYNLDGDGTCVLGALGDLTADPLLSPVLNNAGSIWVYALQNGSPAIDAGALSCLPTDERGVSRPQDGNADGIALCDIGAYELQPGQITVTKKLVPATDPGRFNLLIDGTVYAANVGDGGTTGPINFIPGTSHTVSETAGTNTILSRYVTTIRCSDGSFVVGTSLSGVAAGAGGSVSCTITNTRRLYRVS
jgi:CSLREA domain-containing protein